MLAHGILQISFGSHANENKEKDCKKILTDSKICQKREGHWRGSQAEFF